jgi:hypothetical protein
MVTGILRYTICTEEGNYFEYWGTDRYHRLLLSKVCGRSFLKLSETYKTTATLTLSLKQA